MTLAEILNRHEGKTLEFKRDLTSPKRLLKTLVAFANTAGGKVVIGVEDKTRQTVGVVSPLDDEERLCNMIADAIHPRLVPNIEMVTVDNKTLLIVEVFPSSTRPHYLQSEGGDRGVYVRLGSSNRQADRELIAELRRSVEGIAFDEMPLPERSVENLDLDAARNMFDGTRKLDEQELVTLKLICKDQGRLVPTRGAMLLFGKKRLLQFPDSWVQCGRFIGLDKVSIFDHIELQDYLPMAVDSILLFLKKHAMRGADFSGIRRRDAWSIPLGILREAVINALVHTDYSQRGAPIRISFFDDRIEIENPGILLPGMTIEDMKAGVSKIRNPVIARVFRELGLIEQWGSGVRRMFYEAERLGLPEPEILEIGIRLRFIVRLSKSIQVAPITPDMATDKGAQSRAQSRAQSTDILRVLMSESMSAVKLSQEIGIGSKTGAFKRSIRELLSQGLIEYTIPDKPTSRLQQYSLTHAGREYLKNLGLESS